MDLKKDFHTMFELKAVDARSRVKGGVLLKGRFLLGRNESCDLIINSESISAVHAVIEIFDDHALLYDMNSTNGIWVGEERIVRKEIRLDESFRLADIEFVFRKYVHEKAKSSVLESLEPEHGRASILHQESAPPKMLPKGAPAVSDFNPAFVYPLESDPKAEFSEYIFEDKNELYSIFQYDLARQVVEVIVLFKDRVFSIDYVDGRAGSYQLAGLANAENQIELPIIPKDKFHHFIEFRPSLITVHTLPGFGIYHLSDARRDSGHQATSVELQAQDIIRLDGDELQIYIRQVQAPPQIASAPLIRRNPTLYRTVATSVLTMATLILGLLWLGTGMDHSAFDHAAENVIFIEQRNEQLQAALNGQFRPLQRKTLNTVSFDSHDFTAHKGSLELATVRQVLSEQKAKFRNCEFKGEVKLGFTITASGHVSEAHTVGRASLSDSTFECLEGALKTVSFPAPAGENEVLITQVFRSI